MHLLFPSPSKKPPGGSAAPPYYDQNMRTFPSVIIWAALAFGAPAHGAESPEVRTRQALNLVLARKFPEFYALFSPEMKKAISLETYSAQAERILGLGAPASQEPPVTRTVQGSPLVRIRLHWTLVTLDFLVSWNSAGQIQGTWFRPPEPEKWEAPS